jgi:hypothetical protein
MLPVLSVLAAFAPPPVLDPSTLAWTPGMPDRCECAFVDVGLNNGATLLGWPQTLLQAPHNKTLSELYLKRIRNCLKEANAPCYYGFEASPIHTGPLRALQSRLRTQQIRTLIFAETAFSHEAGNATFYIDESEDVNHPHTRGVGGTTTPTRETPRGGRLKRVRDAVSWEYTQTAIPRSGGGWDDVESSGTA